MAERTAERKVLKWDDERERALGEMTERIRVAIAQEKRSLAKGVVDHLNDTLRTGGSSERYDSYVQAIEVMSEYFDEHAAGWRDTK